MGAHTHVNSVSAVSHLSPVYVSQSNLFSTLPMVMINTRSFQWTSEYTKNLFVLSRQPIVAVCLTSGPGADSDSCARVHAIGQSAIGRQGEDLLVGELRGRGALGGQDVLDLR